MARKLQATPRQDAIVEHVRHNPGCSARSAALATVGICPSEPSYEYGYRAARRAIESGRLVRVRAKGRAGYELHLAREQA